MEEKFMFRKKQVNYSGHWIEDNIYIFQFGEDELEDASGDSCFILVEYNEDTRKLIAECWYSDEVVTIYSDYGDIDVTAPVFPLYDTDIKNIRQFIEKII